MSPTSYRWRIGSFNQALKRILSMRFKINKHCTLKISKGQEQRGF